MKFPLNVLSEYSIRNDFKHSVTIEEWNELINSYNLPIGKDGIYVDKWFRKVEDRTMYDAVYEEILIGNADTIFIYKELHELYERANPNHSFASFYKRKFIEKRGLPIKKHIEMMHEIRKTNNSEQRQMCFYDVVLV